MSAQIFSLVKRRSVGIWVRVSTEFQAQGDSPFHHEARGREYAMQKGWDVTAVYSLEAVSGKSILQHEQTKRMLADVASGKITCLIISKFARLVRNTRELLEIVDIFTGHKAEIASLDEPLAIATPHGRLMLSIISALSEWERGEIGARVSSSLPIRAKLGKPLGGAASFGYKWEDKKLLVDEKEAPIRKLMYELFVIHKRKMVVAKLLNEAGYRTRNGSKFTDTTVDRLLRDPTAKGERRANHTTSKDNKKAWESKPESEWVIVEVEPIVTEEIWDQANQYLDVQRARLTRTTKTATWLFSGIVTCECGQKMYKPSNSPKYVCQKCRNKIPVEALETVFLKILRATFAGNYITTLFVRAQEELVDKRKAITSLEAELQPVKDEMNKCYRAYIANHLDESDFGNLYRPLKRRAQGVEEQIALQRAEVEALEYRYSSEKCTRNAVLQIVDEWWKTASPERHRRLVEGLVQSATLSQDEIIFTFHYLGLLGEEEEIDLSPLSLLCGVSVQCPRLDKPHSVENFDQEVKLLNVEDFHTQGISIA